MLYLFKRAVAILGKEFKRGDHEVSEDVENHPYFLKLINAGFVVESTAPPVVTVQPVEKRSQELFETIKAKQEKAKAARAVKAAAESPNDEAPPVKKGPTIEELKAKTEADAKKAKDDEDAAELAKMEAEEKDAEKKKSEDHHHPKGKHGKGK